MSAEQLVVTFPHVVRSLLDAAYRQPNAQSYEYQKRARTNLSAIEMRKPEIKEIINPIVVRHGRTQPVHDVENVFLDGLRIWGLPFNGSHLVDLRRYTPGTFKFECPHLEGLITNTGIEVLMSLTSGELHHPLAFHQSDPLRRDDYANLVIQAFGPNFRLVQRTSFFFYWDQFQRFDSDIGDGVLNSEVKAGDAGRLRELAGFLKRSYSSSTLVPRIEEHGLRDSFQPHA